MRQNEELDEQGPEQEIRYGSRVRVRTPDGIDLGYGTYVDDQHIELFPDGTIKSTLPGLIRDGHPVPIDPRALDVVVQNGFHTVKIVLESGQVVYGFQYAWCAEGEQTSTVH